MNLDTPMVPNDLTNEQKIALITSHVSRIMQTLGLDLKDDSLADTPRRVAKMYVQELFAGLDKSSYPKITTVDNKFHYSQMLVETNIEVHSVCEHHLVPIVGSAHIAYIPKRKVLGLSKFNRLVRYFAQRPQVQERLTQQIHNELCKILGTKDVAVVIDAYHFCVRMRGVKDTHTITRTSAIDGAFLEAKCRQEFLLALPKASDLSL